MTKPLGCTRRISTIPALLAMLAASAGCGGEPAARSTPSVATTSGSDSVSANQQGGPVAPPSEPGGIGAAGQGGPTQADVLGRQGYGGMQGGGGIGGQALIGGDREHPVPTCGPRESYLYIARDFQCPGGGNPLQGDAAAGAAARSGSVGSHSVPGPGTGDPLMDMHVVDLYEVPCPSGAVQVFVCMYHCPPGQSLQ